MFARNALIGIVLLSDTNYSSRYSSAAVCHVRAGSALSSKARRQNSVRYDGYMASSSSKVQL